jgi:hypothetical protein
MLRWRTVAADRDRAGTSEAGFAGQHSDVEVAVMGTKVESNAEQGRGTARCCDGDLIAAEPSGTGWREVGVLVGCRHGGRAQ